MEPDDAKRRVLVAAEQIKYTTRTISEGGQGTIITADFGFGITINLYNWAVGGDPDKPFELVIGESKARFGIPEAALLMESLRKTIAAACVFEVERDDALSQVLQSAKDGVEN